MCCTINIRLSLPPLVYLMKSSLSWCHSGSELRLMTARYRMVKNREPSLQRMRGKWCLGGDKMQSCRRGFRSESRV